MGGSDVMTWGELEAADPTLAAAGRRLLYRSGDGEALLATVRGDDPPRIHPINVGVVDGGLYAFILRSAKLRDLEVDGRYALHAHVDPAAPTEFMLAGHAREIEADDIRAAVAAAWFFAVDDGYRLFEFEIASALLGERADADEWPPRYRRWSANR